MTAWPPDSAHHTQQNTMTTADKASAVTATTVSNDTPTHVAAPALPSTGV